MPLRETAKRWGWFIAIWLLSVLALSLVAMMIRAAIL
ncbi:DUF2474 family protein [Sagittula sp. SSi028]